MAVYNNLYLKDPPICLLVSMLIRLGWFVLMNSKIGVGMSGSTGTNARSQRSLGFYLRYSVILGASRRGGASPVWEPAKCSTPHPAAWTSRKAFPLVQVRNPPPRYQDVVYFLINNIQIYIYIYIYVSVLYIYMCRVSYLHICMCMFFRFPSPAGLIRSALANYRP